MEQFLERVFLVCGILLFIWTFVLVGRRIISKKSYGEVICIFKDTGASFDLILGLIMSAVALADMVRCVIAEIGLDNRFYLMAAFAFYLLYKGLAKVELRENGIYTRESMSLWNKIGSYEWKNTKSEKKWELNLIKITNGKRLVFMIRAADKDIVDDILKAKIASDIPIEQNETQESDRTELE